ncbi:MAG: YbjQ family protein [Bacteroidaceae bacterium]|jgi:uncharacterized protein YbjQ (UPF0145 family)|nr:YbjQ family protein [Bacteroidaceae bacterium]MBQ2362693.1 YbjQ family protein [Bacteroidaceae bacterium]MBQ5693903.1 YbjQ family protein [Bacteroidaceae bacterium]MBQ5912360.1 YbjQ family protein [Bacteroidaceae bacterium]
MIITTTPAISGKEITNYLGVVTGETIFAINAVRDFFASIRDIVGGRTNSYEEVLTKARTEALNEMQHRAEALGADAIVGVHISYESLGGNATMLMVCCTGTAVKLA